MSPITWIFRECKKLMAKAVTNTMDIGAAIDRKRKLYKVSPVSDALAVFVGKNEISFSTALEIVLDYIDDNELRNLENTEEVLCDFKLMTIFDGKNKVVGLREIKDLLMRHFPFGKKMSSKVAPTNAGYGEVIYREASEPLATFLNEKKVSMAYVLMKVWMYIDAQDLWDEDYTWTETIHCDEKLKTILGGKDKVTANEVLPLLLRHFPDLN